MAEVESKSKASRKKSLQILEKANLEVTATAISSTRYGAPTSKAAPAEKEKHSDDNPDGSSEDRPKGGVDINARTLEKLKEYFDQAEDEGKEGLPEEEVNLFLKSYAELI
jgi:hypothetical protein